MTEEFSQNQAESQFEVHIDDVFAGECHYRLVGDVAVFDHTMVLPEFGGRGVAERLVTYAMDGVRAAGAWKVQPVCSYVAGWFDKHPEYADLLA